MSLKRFLADRRGQYLVQFVIMFPMLLLMVGIVFDGGLMYWQYRRAHVAVNAAAQAASHCVDIDHFRDTNEVILRQAEARGVAQEYVALNGGGQVQGVSVDLSPYWLRVTGRATMHTLFLRLVGISSFSVEVEGLAYPAYGIAVEGE